MNEYSCCRWCRLRRLSRSSSLTAAGHEVWVYDNPSKGHRRAVLNGNLIEGGVADGARVRQVLKEHRIEAVMHFAAFALVGESVADPAIYHRNNVIAALELLDACAIATFAESCSAARRQRTASPRLSRSPKRLVKIRSTPMVLRSW